MDFPPVPYTIVSMKLTYCDIETYVATGEVTSLEHELGNDTVEGRSRVTKALLAGAKSTEVFGGLWDSFIVKEEVDTTGLLCCGDMSALH